MREFEYNNIAQAERKIDFYCGENCDEQEAQWDTFFYTDKDGETMSEPLELDPNNFPAGTRIFISVPLCPQCQYERSEDYQICWNDNCDYDWSEFDSQY